MKNCEFRCSLTFFITMLFFSSTQSQQKNFPSSYSKFGKDWIGKCSSGQFQSPVNIIDGVNTVEDTSVVSFDYSVPENEIHKRLFFNGQQLSMDIDLGKMAFINRRGANEVYQAYKIELHFPSEHYITTNGQTPRYPLELQIYHNLVVTDNSTKTNNLIKVNRAVVSILFSVGETKEGDVFLNQLGISAFNTNEKHELIKFKPEEYVKQENFMVATYASGFNIKTLQGLLNILNADHHTYIYYGSDTRPPCKEDIMWIVFAKPRSISQGQYEFLKNQLVNNVEVSKSVSDAVKPSELYGNRRVIRPYRDDVRGKIWSNKQGVRQVLKQNFFLKKE